MPGIIAGGTTEDPVPRPKFLLLKNVMGPVVLNFDKNVFIKSLNFFVKGLNLFKIPAKKACFWVIFWLRP